MKMHSHPYARLAMKKSGLSYEHFTPHKAGV